MKTRAKASDHRLSQINTSWSDVLKASLRDDREGGDEASARVAQQHVLERYGPCTYRYLLGATRDADVADELNQEFAFRFVRGDFQNVSPEKGRFRDYLKAVLRNIVNDHFRSKQRNQLKPLSENAKSPTVDPFDELEAQFAESWRQELLSSTWNRLKEYQAKRDNHYFSVLRFRAENPGLDSQQLAAQLSAKLSRDVTADWVRQNLKRARDKFCAILISEISKTLPPESTDEQIQAELAELRLLKYASLQPTQK